MAFKPPQKAKRDGNEGEIVDALRQYGFTVERMDKPVDLLATYGGVNYLVEVKNGPKAPLRPAQEKFFAEWPGQKVILCSLDEALDWATEIRHPKRAAEVAK